MKRTIKVDYLARVEGEGSFYLRIDGDRIEEARLKIFEPPRFFEAFLRGRSFRDAPDITARICGICPVAYQMSAVHALERAAGVTLEPSLRELRRLLYCGEWIESHTLHVYMLHAPDFLGYQDAVALAKDAPEVVKRGLEMKRIGNSIVDLLGGREVHPINVRVGGFFRTPSRDELLALREDLLRGRDMAIETVRWSATLPFPDFDRDYQFVSLRGPNEYPFNEGRIVSSTGLDIDADEWEDTFEEVHVAHSNALHCVRRNGETYFLGPMARYALNFAQLPSSVQSLAREVGLGKVCRNPFQSIIVRSVETLFAYEEALRIVENYREPEGPYVDVDPGGRTGCAATEAPRGLLFHRYRVNNDGTLADVRIVPPTSQNQKAIEDDLVAYAQPRLQLDEEALTWQCEQAVRNYDPCISCATHFLKLEIDRK